MNILKYLQDKALTDEYYSTDIHEVILSVKKNNDTYKVKLWKDSPQTKEFVEKYIKEINPNTNIVYEYDMREMVVCKKYEGKLDTKKDHLGNDTIDYDHLICGKCGSILTAKHETMNFNPSEHYNFDCGCGCSYYFPLYLLLNKDYKIMGSCSKEVISRKEYVRSDNYIILPVRQLPSSKNCIKLSEVSIKSYRIIDRIRRKR